MGPSSVAALWEPSRTNGGRTELDYVRRRHLYLRDAGGTRYYFKYRKSDGRSATAAAARLTTGEPLMYVQRQLGHASITTTERCYGHLEATFSKGAAAETEAAI